MRSGNNPSRRNRNIGTAKQGHGSDNAHVIPWPWQEDRIFYERLVNPVVVTRDVHGSEVNILVEPTREDCFHSCTVDDIVAVLEFLPREHSCEIDTVVLRQPKRREQKLACCWGRLVYWATLGRFEGVAIYLEAQQRRDVYRLPLSQDPLGQEEIHRLRLDGHIIVQTHRHFEVTPTAVSGRNTQLYRTLPHEVGHYVHYLQDRLQELDHGSRSNRVKELFAHSYASSFRSSKVASGSIPFARKVDQAQMKREGLEPKWFVV